ncbi:hypothetical protein HC891_18785, partial [Candidatus Gracilibacteria bacterium]|nr:hypothetical protein [Candidatus Gracilibacteria bacterium]
RVRRSCSPPSALSQTLELLPPRTQDIRQFTAAPFAAELRARPGAVADLPFDWQENGRALINQIAHQQPIVGGYVARWPLYPTVSYVPLLRRLVEMKPFVDIVPQHPADLAAMQCAFPLRHVVLYKPALTAADQDAVETTLRDLLGALPQPRFDNTDYRWYELPLMHDACRPFAATGSGWHDLETNGERRWRWIDGQGELWLTNPTVTEVPIQLDLRLESFATTRSLELRAHTGTLLARWHVAPGIDRSYRIGLRLAPGMQRFTLSTPGERDPLTGRDLSIAVLAIDVIVMPGQPRMYQPQRPHFLPTQLRLLSSLVPWFCALGSRFSVLGSRFSVLRSTL